MLSIQETSPMDVTKIPFNQYLDISQATSNDQMLELAFTDRMKNHLGTMHASAQFALAEACSGLSLQHHFPHLANTAVPVLMKSEIKFKKPAQSDIKALATIPMEMKEKFEQQFSKKGRATLAVSVEIQDRNGTITMTGTYDWFVQKI